MLAARSLGRRPWRKALRQSPPPLWLQRKSVTGVGRGRDFSWSSRCLILFKYSVYSGGEAWYFDKSCQRIVLEQVLLDFSGIASWRNLFLKKQNYIIYRLTYEPILTVTLIHDMVSAGEWASKCLLGKLHIWLWYTHHGFPTNKLGMSNEGSTPNHPHILCL